MLQSKESNTQRCEIHIIDVIVHCDKQSSSTSCLAADTVPGLVVFSFQANCFRVGLESGQDLLLLLLEDLSSVDLFHIRVQLLHSLMSKKKTNKKNNPDKDEKCSLFLKEKNTNKVLQSNQVWKYC